MARKSKLLLAGLLCVACLPVPLTASAKCTVSEVDKNHVNFDGTTGKLFHEVTIESDLFRYTVTGDYEVRLYDDDYTYAESAEPHYYFSGVLETDVVEFNFLVTAVLYKEGEDTPDMYILNSPVRGGIGGEQNYVLYYNELIPYLDGDLPQVGDLLYLEDCDITEGIPPMIRFSYKRTPYVHNLGSGLDILGEDFKKVLYYELSEEPYLVGGLPKRTPVGQTSYIYDKGNLNNDDVVNLIDVVTLNKYLMIGRHIGYYAKGCADVDNNGVVDEIDSLNILKSIIGLVDLNELG